MKKFKNQNAITLIALVITIVVLLILAGVALSLVVGEDGITNRAITAAKTQDIAGAKEKLELLAASYAGDSNAKSLGDYVASKFSPGTFEEDFTLTIDANDSRKITISSKNYADNSATCTISDDGQVVWEGNETGTLISTEENYKRCFADLNGDGKIEVDKDGVIYVDLLAQSGEGGDDVYWGDSNGAYTIPTAGTPDNYNKYYVSEEKTSIEGQTGYGEQKMIKLASSSGNPRFYVMALQDFTTDDYTTFYWYKNAPGDMNPSDTSGDFGTGKDNTKNMLDIWNARNGKTAYDTGDNQDLWKHIDSKYNAGWFVPSRAEWGAFGKALNITENSSDLTYYGNFGLGSWYLSSSQSNANGAWDATFGSGCMDYDFVTINYAVRLSETF